MPNKAILFALLAANSVISGCASAPSMPKKVYIPVAGKCQVKPPPRPALAIQHLTNTSPPDQVEKAQTQTIVQLMGYTASLETLLKPFAPSPDRAP